MADATISISVQSASSERTAGSDRNSQKNPRKKQEKPQKKQGDGPAKMRGLEKDSPAVRLSKTLSWLLRHGAKSEGLPMRADGYVDVKDLLENSRIKGQGLDLAGLQDIVKMDAKKRYDLIEDAGKWWIKANQGHSIETVKLDLKPILSPEDIPTGVAVHGTTRKAWELISKEGLSKMKRNHIHFAQGVPGNGIISGMRNSSQVLIYVDVRKALDAGIEFFLSDNGVVLSAGKNGIILPDFFHDVQDAGGQSIPGWQVAIAPAATPST